MTPKCVPMIHVPDVRATVDWYRSIGFIPSETYADAEGGLSFAILTFGSSDVMFNSGGRPAAQARREVDLYIYTENVDALHQRLQGRVDVIEGPHDTFYGTREVIIRDPNGFWVTFGETSAGEMLMAGVVQGDADAVRAALRRPGLTPERLSAALAAATTGDRRDTGIVEMLEGAGAVAVPVVDAEVLRRYAGTYTTDQGLSVTVTLKDGGLLAVPDGAQPSRLLPLTQTVFKPIDLADATITFGVGADGARRLSFRQGSRETRFRRAADGSGAEPAPRRR